MIIIISIVIRWINILLYDYIVDARSIPFDCIEFIRNIVAEILLMSEKYGTLLSHHYRVVCNIIVATKRWLCLWKPKDQHHYHHAVRLMRIRCDFVWQIYAEVGNRSKLVAVVEITIPFRRVILLVEISYFVPFYYQWLFDTRTQTHSDTHNNVCIFIASALKFALTDKFLFDFCFGFVFVFTYWFVFQSFRVCARTLLFFCFSLSSSLILFPF